MEVSKYYNTGTVVIVGVVVDWTPERKSTLKRSDFWPTNAITVLLCPLGVFQPFRRVVNKPILQRICSGPLPAGRPSFRLLVNRRRSDSFVRQSVTVTPPEFRQL